MKYEISSKQGDRYNVTGSDDRGEYIFYRGTYDAKSGLWKLEPKAGTPREYGGVRYVPAHAVRWMKPLQLKQNPKKKPEPADKPKAWWVREDLPGQIEMV